MKAEFEIVGKYPHHRLVTSAALRENLGRAGVVFSSGRRPKWCNVRVPDEHAIVTAPREVIREAVRRTIATFPFFWEIEIEKGSEVFREPDLIRITVRSKQEVRDAPSE